MFCTDPITMIWHACSNTNISCHIMIRGSVNLLWLFLVELQWLGAAQSLLQPQWPRAQPGWQPRSSWTQRTASMSRWILYHWYQWFAIRLLSGYRADGKYYWSFVKTVGKVTNGVVFTPHVKSLLSMILTSTPLILHTTTIWYKL